MHSLLSYLLALGAIDWLYVITHDCVLLLQGSLDLLQNLGVVQLYSSLMRLQYWCLYLS
jgi:hypothetical protein